MDKVILCRLPQSVFASGGDALAYDISIAAKTNQAFALAVLYIWIQKQICSQVVLIEGLVPYTTAIYLTISTVQSKCYL